ncbi:hypothetical protein [Rhodococcus rhodochrous]|uniref:hypothetical protein n=1 Tax=Rhodococcus rhodochrous TaxID=1829 RepID=UPI0021BD0740|nr:hypothetical protein [Rhodococcus rhodochrous]
MFVDHEPSEVFAAFDDGGDNLAAGQSRGRTGCEYHGVGGGGCPGAVRAEDIRQGRCGDVTGGLGNRGGDGAAASVEQQHGLPGEGGTGAHDCRHAVDGGDGVVETFVDQGSFGGQVPTLLEVTPSPFVLFCVKNSGGGVAEQCAVRGEDGPLLVGEIDCGIGIGEDEEASGFCTVFRQP